MKKKKKGMSLVELVAAMAILAIVSMAITSTLLLAVKSNSRNKAKLYSNECSRSFIELIKTQEYRPSKPSTPAAPKQFKEGWYYIACDNSDDINAFIDTKIASPTAIAGTTNGSTLSSAISKSGRSTQKFVMSIKIDWNSVDNVYDMDVYSWEVAVGEGSKMNRKVLLAPQI